MYCHKDMAAFTENYKHKITAGVHRTSQIGHVKQNNWRGDFLIQQKDWKVDLKIEK